MSRQELDLLQFYSSGVAQPGAGSRQVVRRQVSHSDLLRELLKTYQTTFSVTPSPHTLPALLTRRNTFPVVMPAAVNHDSSSCRTQSGIELVRTCPPLPTRSTMTQPSARCWRWSKVNSA